MCLRYSVGAAAGAARQVDAYAASKRDLVARHATDRESYTSAKADFVRAVLERAIANP